MGDASDLFKKIGFDDKKAAENGKNKEVSENMRAVLEEAGLNETDKTTGSLLYQVATKFPANAKRHRAFIARNIVSKQITNTNIQPCLDYLKKLGADDLNEATFKEECGLGFVVSKEQVQAAVSKLIEQKREELLTKRYRVNIGLYLQALKQQPETKWADGKLMNDELTAQMQALLGPRTAEDDKPLEKTKPEKPKEKPKEKEEEKPKEKEEDDDWIPPQESIRFPDPKENVQQTKEILDAHLKRTGARVYTRFPLSPMVTFTLVTLKPCT